MATRKQIEEMIDEEGIILLNLLHGVQYRLSGGPPIGILRRVDPDTLLDTKNKLLAMVQCIDRYGALKEASQYANT